MARLRLQYRLPLAGHPCAVFDTDYTYAGGRLEVDGRTVLEVTSRDELARGVSTELPGSGAGISVRLVMDGSIPSVVVEAEGRRAPELDELRVPTARSAYVHAWLALAASAAGFIASYLYLERAELHDSLHAFKMAYHMAGWHLLLTFTLFPASVWGQRTGIRSVQVTSLLFFCIHLGIAIANAMSRAAADSSDLRIAVWNAVSGLFFLAAVVYGNKAYRDMDPARTATGQPSTPLEDKA